MISEQGKYIGYILLLADKKEDIPKPFTFLACHNGDTLPKETHKKNIGIYRQTVSCKQLEINSLGWPNKKSSNCDIIVFLSYLSIKTP